MESEKRLLDIINFLPDATFAIDRSGTVIAWNRAMEEMTGRSMAEMMGKGDFEYAIPFYGTRRPVLIDLVFSPEDEIKQKYSFVRADKVGLTAETTNAIARGESCVLWGRAAPLMNSDGVIIGAIESIRDITDSKKAEETLARSKDYLDQIFSSVKAGIVIIDALTHEIVDINPAGAAMIGLPKDQIIGNICHKFICPAETGQCPITDLHKNVDNAERMLITGDGKKIPIIKYVTRTNLDGRERLLETFIDNSERRRADDALRESEAKYRDLAELLPQMIFETDLDLRITYANQRAHTEMGFTDQDLERGINALSLIAPSQHEHMRDNVQKSLDGISFDPKEYTALRKNGSTFPVVIYSTPMHRNNTLAGFRAVVVDISALKRVEEELLQKNEDLHAAYEQLTSSEEELRQNYNELSKKEGEIRASEEKFRVLVELSLDGIIITDFLGKLLFANRAAGLIVDAPDYKAMIGTKNVIDFVAPVSRAKVLWDFSQVALGIDAYLVNYKLITETKREIWVECIGKKIKYGDSSAMLVSMRDITDRRKSEEALQKSEERFRLLTTGSSDVIGILDSAGKYTYISNNVVNETGYKPDKYEGKFALEFLHPDDQNKIRGTIASLLLGNEKNRVLECRVNHKDRGWIWIEALMTNQIDHPAIKGIVLNMREITERKRVEEALRMANKKLNLLSDVTRHDIKNQLLALNAYIELSKKSLGDAAKISEFITKEEQITRTIEHQITFTKEYENVGVNVPVWQDCRTIVENAVGWTPIGQISVKNDLPAGTEVFADPLIVEVFYNLVDNAVRHGGKITTIRFSVEERDGDHVVICEDDGDGVIAEEKERIFDRGFGNNTGLGLALSREILDITGIRIRETGEPGKGARFEIVIPKGTYRFLDSK
jgi:PAS domain S-box-containing protein